MLNRKTQGIFMTIAALMGTTQVGAQYQTTGLTIQTGAFLSVEPNPVGVGQSVQVTFWVEPIHPLPDDVFHDFKVTITHPDGKVENKGPYKSLGRQSLQFFTYIPTTVGNYTFHFKYPGEKFSSTNDTFLASTAQDVTLIVQEEPVGGYPQPHPNKLLDKTNKCSEHQLGPYLRKLVIQGRG